MSYSTYTDVYRISGLSDTEVAQADVTSFIEEADEFIDGITHQNFGTPTQKTEYFDGERNTFLALTASNTTTSDISARDWNTGQNLYAREPYHKDSLTTSFYPITNMDRVYFLSRGTNDLQKVWSDDGGSFTDNTTEANSVGGTAFNAFAATPAVNDALYIGHSDKFEDVQVILSTAGVDAGSLAVAWEYYNGSSWVDLSETDNTSALTDTNTVTFVAPSNWAKVSVNSSTEYYFIRCRVTAGSYSTAPTVNQTYMIDVIETEINTRDIQFETWGKVSFMANSIPDGTRNIKLVYKYGHSSVPKKVRQLSANIAACAALFNMIGGSFDDVTAYTIPEFSVSKGEPYTNMRAAIIEIQKSIWGSPPGERGKYVIGLVQEVGREIKFETT